MPKYGTPLSWKEQQLRAQEKTKKKTENAVINLAQMVIENSRITGRLIALYEVLKDKGLFKDEDIEAKLKEFEAKREQDAKQSLEATRKEIVQNKDKTDSTVNGLRSDNTGSDEGGQ